MKRPEILKTGTIIDADEPVMLTITSTDIKKARPKDPLHCAAAQALKRQLKVTDAIIMRSTVYINEGSKKSPIWVRYQNPPSLQREVVALDRGGKVEPGTYKLSPYPDKAKLGAKPYVRRTESNGKGKSPRYIHVTTNIR